MSLFAVAWHYLFREPPWPVLVWGEAAEGSVIRRGWQGPSHAQQGHAMSLEGPEGNMVLWDNLICCR